MAANTIEVVLKSIDQMSADLGRVEQALGKLQTGAAKGTGAFKSLGSGIQSFAFGIKGALANILLFNQSILLIQTAFGPLIRTIKEVVRTAVSFESAFTGVQKTVNATKPELEKLRQDFLELSKTIPLTAEELFHIGELGGQLGISTGGLIKFTETVAALAVTTNLSVDEAATAIARFRNIMETSEGELENIASAIVDLGNNFATTEKEITQFGLRLAAAGKQIGLSEGEVLGFGTALSSVGVEAERGGTALSKTFFQIQKAVNQAGSDLELLAEISRKTSKEFADTFKKDAAEAIILFLEGLGKLEKTKTVKVLESLRLEDQRLIQSLLSVANAQGLVRRAVEDGRKAYEENTAAAKEAGLRYGTAASQFQKFDNQLRILTNTIGQLLTPPLIDLLHVLTPTIIALDRLINSAARSERIKANVATIRDLTQQIDFLRDRIIELNDPLVRFIDPFGIIIKRDNVFQLTQQLEELKDRLFEAREQQDLDELIQGLRQAGRTAKGTANDIGDIEDSGKKVAGLRQQIAQLNAELSKAKAQSQIEIATELQLKTGQITNFIEIVDKALDEARKAAIIPVEIQFEEDKKTSATLAEDARAARIKQIDQQLADRRRALLTQFEQFRDTLAEQRLQKEKDANDALLALDEARLADARKRIELGDADIRTLDQIIAKGKEIADQTRRIAQDRLAIIQQTIATLREKIDTPGFNQQQVEGFRTEILRLTADAQKLQTEMRGINSVVNDMATSFERVRLLPNFERDTIRLEAELASVRNELEKLQTEAALASLSDTSITVPWAQVLNYAKQIDVIQQKILQIEIDKQAILVDTLQTQKEQNLLNQQQLADLEIAKARLEALRVQARISLNRTEQEQLREFAKETATIADDMAKTFVDVFITGLEQGRIGIKNIFRDLGKALAVQLLQEFLKAQIVQLLPQQLLQGVKPNTVGGGLITEIKYLFGLVKDLFQTQSQQLDPIGQWAEQLEEATVDTTKAQQDQKVALDNAIASTDGFAEALQGLLKKVANPEEQPRIELDLTPLNQSVETLSQSATDAAQAQQLQEQAIDNTIPSIEEFGRALQSQADAATQIAPPATISISPEAEQAITNATIAANSFQEAINLAATNANNLATMLEQIIASGNQLPPLLESTSTALIAFRDGLQQYLGGVGRNQDINIETPNADALGQALILYADELRNAQVAQAQETEVVRALTQQSTILEESFVSLNTATQMLLVSIASLVQLVNDFVSEPLSATQAPSAPLVAPQLEAGRTPDAEFIDEFQQGIEQFGRTLDRINNETLANTSSALTQFGQATQQVGNIFSLVVGTGSRLASAFRNIIPIINQVGSALIQIANSSSSSGSGQGGAGFLGGLLSTFGSLFSSFGGSGGFSGGAHGLLRLPKFAFPGFATGGFPRELGTTSIPVHRFRTGRLQNGPMMFVGGEEGGELVARIKPNRGDEFREGKAGDLRQVIYLVDQRRPNLGPDEVEMVISESLNRGRQVAKAVENVVKRQR